MKNKTYLKASFREIAQSKGRFIAIVLIIFLGTLLFVGVKATGPVLNYSASQYVDKHQLSDFQIISTAGITEKDLALAKTADTEVESGYQFYYSSSEKNQVVQIFSYNEKNKQNQLILSKGQLPKSENELVLDSLAENQGYKIGDTYTVNEPDYLKRTEYTIVGFVDSPMFVSTERGYSTVGNGSVDYFVYIPEANFTMDVKSVMYITFPNLANKETYSEGYKKQLAHNQEKLEQRFKARPQQRLEEIQKTARKQLAPAQKEVSEGLQELNEGQEQLDQAVAQIEQQKTALAQLPEVQQQVALAQLKPAIQELAKQQQTIDENREKLAQAKEKIETNEQEIADLAKPTILFHTRADNPGFQEYGDLSERIAAIANVFPVFFFFIAALITFTTMTRMVEENRREIGTLKALGYSKMEISKKYIIYSLLASALGIIVGTISGTEILPRIIYGLSSDRYTLGGVQIFYVWQPIILATVAFLLAALGSALVVLFRELHEKPAQLLQARAPRPGKRIFLESITPLWSRLSFNQKVSYRNIFRYKSRMIMAIIGISGCAGLMVAGVGLKDSLGSVTDKQFGPIIAYQAVVTLADDPTSENRQEVTDLLQHTSKIESVMDVFTETVEMRQSGQANQSMTMNVTTDKKEFSQFVHLNDLSGKSISLSDNGAVITKKIAELFDVHKGDSITVYDSDQQALTVKVENISENYLGNFLYLSKAYYENISENTFDSNSLLIRAETLTTKEENTLSEKLLATDSVVNTTFISTQIEAQEGMMSNLDAIVLIFVVLSGLLAFIVLYNLTNINVSERIRELSTIKVLGFFDKEVTMYIVRENIVFTLLGILAGYGVGYVLTDFILRQASMENMIFPLVITPAAYLLSGGLTILFTIIVMIVTHFKLKHIDMIDALKSNE